MISFRFETQRPVCWTSVTSCFVLLATLCCCSCVPHQKTVRMVDPLQSASESSTTPDTTKQQDTKMVDLGSLLDAVDGGVVTLVAGDTRLAAHWGVLAAGSPVLAAMVHPDTLEASGSDIDIPGVEGPVLRQLVAFLYSGRAPQLSGITPQLLAAAEKYSVSSLRDSIEQQLAEQLSVENAAATAVLAQRYSCHSLRQAAATFIRDHLEVLATEGWAAAVFNHPGEVVEISRLLVEPPAQTRSLSAEDKGWRLREAAAEGSVQEVKALLALGADVDARDSEVRQTPLHTAAANGRTAVLRLLLAASADLGARNKYGHTPLQVAAWWGQAAAAAALLEAGADKEARGNDGLTALDIARDKNYEQLVQILQ